MEQFSEQRKRGCRIHMKCPTCGKELEFSHSIHTYAMGLENENISNRSQKTTSYQFTADFDTFHCPFSTHSNFCFFKGKHFTYVWVSKQLMWIKLSKFNKMVTREEVMFT